MTTTTTTTEEPTETTTTESDGGIPGFGIGVALVAFVAAALLALRRSN
jgi:PGF-CTERM protein